MLNNCYTTKLIIRESGLKKNITFFKSKIPKKTKIIAVIKANAYGYGDVNMAQKLIKNGIKSGVIGRESIYESLISFKRAGASAVVTYFADQIARDLK